MKLLTNLNLNQNELQNAVIQKLAAAPSTPVEAQFYYHTVDKKWYWRNDTTWVDITAAATAAVATTANQLTTARTIDGVSFNGTANITVIAPGTTAATSKVTPVDADEIPLVDSAASNTLKKLTWANLKATNKTYTDTLYQPLDSDLTTIAGLTATTNNFIVSVGSAWASRTPTQVKTTLSLDNVDNTSDINKPVSTATQTALNLKADLASPALTGVPTAPTAVTGTNTTQIATTAFVTSAVADISANVGKRARARVATIANITISTGLNNGDALDGVILATGDLVLVKDQTATAENGVYVVGVTPIRATEFDTYNEHSGSLIAVAEGTVNADTIWLCTSNDGGTLNTTPILFSKLVVAGELLAANNLSDLSNISTARTNLGLVIGTNVQAWDTDLDAIATLGASNDDFIQRKAGVWTNRTVAQVKTDLNLSGTNTGDQVISDATITTTDITTNNVSSIKHGFAPKSPSDATTFLNGAATPAYAAVKDSDLSTTDIITNNASTTKHGFLKKLSNVATEFMDGTGNWSTPVGAVLRYSTDIGDGTSTSITITHNLGTRDLVASIRSTTTPWEVVLADVEMTSTTTTTIRFSVAPTAASLRVTLVG